jgi:hypothetical protein
VIRKGILFEVIELFGGIGGEGEGGGGDGFVAPE